MLESHDSGRGGPGRKPGERLAGSDCEGELLGGRGTVFDSQSHSVKEVEAGNSQMRSWWGSSRQAPGRPHGRPDSWPRGARDSLRTGVDAGEGPKKAWGRPRGGLTAGLGRGGCHCEAGKGKKVVVSGGENSSK